MNYFDLYPNVLLPSFSDKRNSSKDYVAITNLFKRAKIRDDIFESVKAFYSYIIEGDDRPDNVAKKVYENDKLDWVVLISNNILDIKNEWPMNGYDFQRYLDAKYTRDQLGEIHHYETNEIRNEDGAIMLESGLTVDSDFTYSYSYKNKRYHINSVQSVSYIEYETKKNDDKRSINLLRPQYIPIIIDDMREILTYEDSSQFVSRKMKKGDNVRIAEPR